MGEIDSFLLNGLGFRYQFFETDSNFRIENLWIWNSLLAFCLLVDYLIFTKFANILQN